MKIVKGYPPIWDWIEANGMKPDIDNVICTYGDTIYVPSGRQLPPDLIEHEKVHMDQQKHNDSDAHRWWGRYVNDKHFRIEQEAEAYAKQFKFICNTVKDRERRNRVLIQLAHILSGPAYGEVITTQAAMFKIKERSGIK